MARTNLMPFASEKRSADVCQIPPLFFTSQIHAASRTDSSKVAPTGHRYAESKATAMRLFTQAALCLPPLAQVSHARQAAAVPKDSPDLCVRSCEASLKSLRFADVNATASPLRQACQSRLALSSKYLCLSLNCGTRTCDSAIQHHNATCYDSFGSPIPAFRTDFTDEEIAGVKKIGKGDTFGSDNPLAGVVLPSPERFGAWFETLVLRPFLSVLPTIIDLIIDT